ncbi:hypothetical protein Lal_00046403, partial [Lupinus albus]
RFVAQIVSTKQTCVEETNKSNLGVSNLNEFRQFIFIDDDELKSTKDQSVPMSLEQTEAMHGEPDQMEEIEMEDINGEPFFLEKVMVKLWMKLLLPMVVKHDCCFTFRFQDREVKIRSPTRGGFRNHFKLGMLDTFQLVGAC